MGYLRGYEEGCLQSTGPQPQKQPTHECPPLYPPGDRNKDWVLDSTKFSDEMTEFYTRYPEDKDVPFHYLSYAMMGSGSKSIDEIHKQVSLLL
jgi:hypothetical protein